METPNGVDVAGIQFSKVYKIEGRFTVLVSIELHREL